MIQTLEAVIDKTGKISVLTKLRLKQSRRALVTILDEDPKIALGLTTEMPKNEAISDMEVLNVWANHSDSAPEIARKLRNRNRDTT